MFFWSCARNCVIALSLNQYIYIYNIHVDIDTVLFFGFYDQLGCVSVMLGKCRIHRSQVCLHGNLQHKKQHDGNHHNVLTKDDANMICRTHFENEPTLKLKVMC